MECHHFDTENGSYVVRVEDRSESLPLRSIFVHGGPGVNVAPERSMFAPALGPSSGFIWFDHLGCGECRLSSPDRLSWDAQVDDVAQVARHFGDGPVNFVGHCVGVKIIDDLVSRYRSLVGSATWISPAADVAEVFKTIIKLGLSEGRLDKATLSADQVRGIDGFLSTPAALFSKREALLFLGIVPLIRDFPELYWTNPDAMKAYLAVVENAPFAPQVFIRLSHDYFTGGPRDVPDYAGIPLQVLHSSEDRITPWEQHGATMMDKIPHAEIHEVEGGSHWIHLQKPQATASRILSTSDGSTGNDGLTP